MIPVVNEEMFSVRELGRSYARMVRRLEETKLDKIVLMKHGKMQAILITPEEYERLLDAQTR